VGFIETEIKEASSMDFSIINFYSPSLFRFSNCLLKLLQAMSERMRKELSDIEMMMKKGLKKSRHPYSR